MSCCVYIYFIFTFLVYLYIFTFINHCPYQCTLLMKGDKRKLVFKRLSRGVTSVMRDTLHFPVVGLLMVLKDIEGIWYQLVLNELIPMKQEKTPQFKFFVFKTEKVLMDVLLQPFYKIQVRKLIVLQKRRVVVQHLSSFLCQSAATFYFWLFETYNLGETACTAHIFKPRMSLCYELFFFRGSFIFYFQNLVVLWHLPAYPGPAIGPFKMKHTCLFQDIISNFIGTKHLSMKDNMFSSQTFQECNRLQVSFLPFLISSWPE